MFNDINLDGKNVFVRADLNVPMEQGVILDDHRLSAILPTIDELIKKGAIIILGTHLGRPSTTDPRLSTRQLIDWFKKKGYTIDFAENIYDIKAIPIKKHKNIILLENIRFFKGEQSSDTKERKQLSQALAKWAEFYVCDAFGVMHRNDTSIIDLPLLFPPHKRSLGYATTEELQTLTSLTTPISHPFLVISGGNKLSSKLPFVKNLIYRGADTIAWCPAPVFTILHIQNKPVGKSFIDKKAINKAKQFLQEKWPKHITFTLPVDYQVAQNTVKGALSFVSANAFPSWGMGISIGPQTIALYTNLINMAKLIIYNGLMGMLDRPETLGGTIAILKVMSQAKGTTIVAGGDTVAVVHKYGLKGIDHVSIGGGATLAYLSGKQLPCLNLYSYKN